MTATTSPQPFRISNRVLGALVISGVWATVAVVNGAQNLMRAEVRGSSLTVGAAFTQNLVYLVIWAVATPVIVRTVRRFPVRRGVIVRNGVIHVMLGSVFIVLLNVAGIFLEALLTGGGLNAPAIVAWAARSIVDVYHAALMVYLIIVAIGHAPWGRWIRTARETKAQVARVSERHRADGVEPRRVEQIAVRLHRSTHLLSVDRVDWIEAAGDHVILHAGGERHRVRERLKTLHERLDPHRFVRIHRSAIVNVARVASVQPYSYGDYSVLLSTGRQLRLSRTRRRDLEGALGQRL